MSTIGHLAEEGICCLKLCIFCISDEDLKSQVHEMLRKQEEKRRRREGSASSTDKKKPRKTSVPVHCQNDPQQKKMLEIETSVNMTERQGTYCIVVLYAFIIIYNKKVGQLLLFNFLL